jgi:hypothetical protein
MTLEDLIRDGLDVEVIPPGTAVLLRPREHLGSQVLLDRLRDQVAAVQDHLGVRIAVVSPDLDVILIPPGVNGVPPEQEIQR